MRVVVIGAGFAGMAAACRLAGDGHSVTVLEAAPRLGGRAASFERNGLQLDYGQHVLLRACGAAQGFLERIGALDAVSFQDSLAIPLLCDGERSVLRSWPLPGITHLLPGLLGYRPLARRERLAAVRGGLALWASHSSRAETFADWLERHGQTERIIRRLWDPVVIAALNAPSRVVSSCAARQVFLEAFFVPHGADMGLFTRPLGDVFRASLRYVEARGGIVEVDSPAGAVSVSGGRARGVRLASGREIAADAVICATPPDALSELVTGIPELGQIVGAAEHLQWSPIVNVHLTFDRKVLDDAFAIGIDSTVQVVFTRGTTDGHQTLILSQSAAGELMDLADEEIVAELDRALRELLPSARNAKLVDSLVLRHRRATFVPAPGSGALRPKSRTPIAGLYLAGDWTATGWPSTIESAVLSGVYAVAVAERDFETSDQAGAVSDTTASAEPR